jgi:hypothetical protein
MQGVVKNGLAPSTLNSNYRNLSRFRSASDPKRTLLKKENTESGLLEGNGVFLIKVTDERDKMNGYCAFHDKDSSQIESSEYAWGKINRLVDGDHNIDCKITGIGAMMLKSEFVKKA